MKTYFGLENPPVKIAKFAIGDGSLGTDVVSELMPMVRVYLVMTSSICLSSTVEAHYFGDLPSAYCVRPRCIRVLQRAVSMIRSKTTTLYL